MLVKYNFTLLTLSRIAFCYKFTQSTSDEDDEETTTNNPPAPIAPPIQGGPGETKTGLKTVSVDTNFFAYKVDAKGDTTSEKFDMLLEEKVKQMIYCYSNLLQCKHKQEFLYKFVFHVLNRVLLSQMYILKEM